MSEQPEQPVQSAQPQNVWAQAFAELRRIGNPHMQFDVYLVSWRSDQVQVQLTSLLTDQSLAAGDAAATVEESLASLIVKMQALPSLVKTPAASAQAGA